MTAAIILAGGLGTRLRGAVPELPKPMAPIGGRPFLEYQLDYWIAQGVTRYVLAVGYRHDAITGWFGSSYRGASLGYVIEESPLGTGGGLLLALGELDADAPFLLLNGDTYFAVELDSLKAFARQSSADVCFSLFRTYEDGRYMGMDLSPDGRITSLRSGMNVRGRLANGGVYWIQPRALSSTGFAGGMSASLEADIFPSALAAGRRLYGREFPGTFIDIGVPDDYHRAASLLIP